MKRNLISAVALLALLCAPNVMAQTCTGSISGSILRSCHTLAQVIDALPCGVTDIQNSNCGSDMSDCYFDVGFATSSDIIAVEWEKDSSTGAVPARNKCYQAKASVPSCFNEPPFFEQCPDPLSSEDDPCWPYCCDSDSLCFTDDSDHLSNPEDVAALWTEPCRAYALMPTGYSHWTPAEAFFTVGRHFPLEGLSWDTPESDDAYGAERALVEGQLGQTMLGAVDTTPLWGDKDGFVNTASLLERGLCVDERGALLASPLWHTSLDGVKHFPLVRLGKKGPSCLAGMDLYTNRHLDTGEPLTSEDWSRSGALIEDVLPRLERLGQRRGLELLCITQEVADARRTLRSADRVKE